jgi:Uma2 family endonuclease
MLKTRIPRQQRFILDGVSWQRYTRLLHLFSDRHLRLTYDRGFLEIMTLSYEHEGLAHFHGRMIIALTEELNLPIAGGGSTTFRIKRKEKGLEPDDCYWIAHESDVRGKKRIDLRTDPPPDVAVEVDISRSSMDRMGIYASLRVPEVWRHDAHGLAFFSLNSVGEYDPAAASPTFPIAVTPADLMQFIQLRGKLDDNAIIKQFRQWIRRQRRRSK